MVTKKKKKLLEKVSSKKEKFETDYKDVGTPRLREIELEEMLVLTATLDDTTAEGELRERIQKLEEETSSPELEEELEEAMPKKVKKKKH